MISDNSRKPKVFIIKAYSWKSAHLLTGHPEYSAIFKLVDKYADSVDFIVTGTSREYISAYRMKENLTAWDIPDNGLIGSLAYYIQLFRIIIKYKPRLTVVLGLTSALPPLIFTILSSKSQCVPVFMGEWGYYGRKSLGRVLNNFQFKILAIILRISRPKMPYIFALSNFVRKNIEAMAPILKGTIQLISYPISKTFSSSIRKSESAVQPPIILTVAGIDPRKGLDVLIRAVSLIPNEVQPNVIIKGEVRDPVYMKHLVKMVTDLNLAKKVTFVTKTVKYHELLSFYESALLFVFPTREDSLGVVILEAIHAGLPVIATSVGGIPDMIENGVTGVLVKPDDPEVLAQAIQMLLRDGYLRSTLAQRAFDPIKKDYYQRIDLEEALDKTVQMVLS